MNPGSKSWPAIVATSRAVPGRRIGRADGPDRAKRGHFMKNPFNFLEMNSRSRSPLRIFFKKHLRLFPNKPAIQNGWALFFLQKRPSLYRKSTRAPETLSEFFSKISSDFYQIKIQANFDYICFFLKKAETLKLHRTDASRFQPPVTRVLHVLHASETSA